MDLNPAQIDRKIAALALPSLATLLVEPLLIVVDSTMIGRLGTVPLAGLSLSSTVLTTIVGVCIFLAYATTAATARYVGAGEPRKALRQGLDGMWLAVALGAGLGAILLFFAPAILDWFGPRPDVLDQAAQYLQASAFGLPGMLLVLAATGTLRGFADAQTPLQAATAGALVNIPLNIALIYGADLGVAGAGFGTAIAQTGMGAYLAWKVLGRAANERVPFRPSGAGVLRSLQDAVPLIVRTLSLRAAILLQIAAATSLGTLALASNQIVMTVWNFSAYGLDALATAAQILVGQGLGSKEKERVRLILRRCLTWGVRVGLVLTAAYSLLGVLAPRLMSTDPDVHHLAMLAIWVTAGALPIAAVAYILDGVLIGAGDTKALAYYMVAALVAFTPFAMYFAGPGADLGTWGMLGLWASYVLVFMGVRTVTILRRVRGDEWMRLGSN